MMEWSLGQVKKKNRIPLRKAEVLAEKVYQRLLPYSQFILVAGSIRRRRPEVGDIEFVVLPADLGEMLQVLDRMGYTGGNRKRTLFFKGMKIEIYLAHKPEEVGAMLFTYTGDYLFNISMRSIAKRRGWKLDQYGIQDAETGEWILQSPYEEDFFGALGVDYHTPEERSFAHRKESRPSMGVITPRDWSPRGDIPGHRDQYPNLRKKIGWDGKEWRPADTAWHDRWIWYGPGGFKGGYATEVEKLSRGWKVAEYTPVENRTESDNILKIDAIIEDDFLAEVLYRTNGMLADEKDFREEPSRWYRWAVSLGVSYLAYYGGDESWVESLP